MTTKKLIGFDNNLLEKIESFATENDMTFTNAVRTLIQKGLGINPNDLDKTDSEVLNELIDKVDKLSWWTTDDNTSRLHNIEVAVEDMEKKINVLTAASKLFKKHLSDNDIHLQD